MGNKLFITLEVESNLEKELAHSLLVECHKLYQAQFLGSIVHHEISSDELFHTLQLEMKTTQPAGKLFKVVALVSGF